jgi:hypothetical protein
MRKINEGFLKCRSFFGISEKPKLFSNNKLLNKLNSVYIKRYVS